MIDEERLRVVAKAIETIRLRHGLGRRTCLGYEEPPETGVEGELVCPVCGGRLVYGVSSYNGATKGRCETEGCLFWAE